MKIERLFERNEKEEIVCANFLGKTWLVNKNNITQRVAIEDELPLSKGCLYPDGSKKKNDTIRLYRAGKDFICIFWNSIYLISGMKTLTWLPLPGYKQKEKQILIGLSQENKVDLELFEHKASIDYTYDIYEEYDVHDPIGTLNDVCAHGFSYMSELYEKSPKECDMEWSHLLERLTVEECKDGVYYTYCVCLIGGYYFRFSESKAQEFSMKKVIPNVLRNIKRERMDIYQFLGEKGLFTLENFQFYELSDLYSLLDGNYKEYLYRIFNANSDNPLVFVSQMHCVVNDPTDEFSRFVMNLKEEDLKALKEERNEALFCQKGILYDIRAKRILYTAIEEQSLPFSQLEREFVFCGVQGIPHIMTYPTVGKDGYEICWREEGDSSFSSLYVDIAPTILYCEFESEILFLKLKKQLNPDYHYFSNHDAEEVDIMLVLNAKREKIACYYDVTFKERISYRKNKKEQPDKKELYAEPSDILMVRKGNVGNNHFVPIPNVFVISDVLAHKGINWKQVYSHYSENLRRDYEKQEMVVDDITLIQEDEELKKTVYIMDKSGEPKEMEVYIKEKLKRAPCFWD